MASLKWCCRQKDGIKFIEPNDNLARGYLKMAEDSLGTMNRERNKSIRWAISSCYYSMYYSLYSVFMKIGIKCEIHSCTLEFMKIFLNDFYSKEDMKIIKMAFDSRNIVQYYVDGIVSTEDSEHIMKNAPLFFNKSREILAKINEKSVKEIKEKFKSIYEMDLSK